MNTVFKSPRGLILMIITMLVLVSGCAQKATYNPAYVGKPAIPDADKVAGKVLVYTEKTDDDTLWSGKPTSFTGSATTLSIPLGLIAREIAATVFGDAFRDGAVKANALTDASDYRVIIRPKVSAFSYEYNQLKNIGFAITPTVVLTLEVSLLDAGGKMVNQRRYDSGRVEVSAYIISGSPGEEIGKAAHKALNELMVRAAQDVREALRKPDGAPLSL